MDAKKAINLARVVLALGIIAFFLGYGAEISKPASGTLISGEGVGSCTYPQYDSVVLGGLCAVSFLGFFILGLACLFYIYNGVPINALTWGTNLFFAFTVIGSLLAEPMVIWATIAEGIHHAQNVHNLETCPPAQKRLFRGASISVLVAVLCWYGCLITMLRAHADYLRGDPHYRPGGNRNETTPPKGLDCNKIHPVLSEDA